MLERQGSFQTILPLSSLSNDVSNRKYSAPPIVTPPASHPIIMMNLLPVFCHFVDFAIYHTLITPYHTWYHLSLVSLSQF